MVTHTIDPSTQEAETRESLSSRPACSTELTLTYRTARATGRIPVLKNNNKKVTRWCRPLILAPRWQREEYLCEFEAGHGYKVRPCLKTKTNQTKKKKKKQRQKKNNQTNKKTKDGKENNK